MPKKCCVKSLFTDKTLKVVFQGRFDLPPCIGILIRIILEIMLCATKLAGIYIGLIVIDIPYIPMKIPDVKCKMYVSRILGLVLHRVKTCWMCENMLDV